MTDVTLYGPPDTDYSGGLFIAILTFTKDYPFEPPTMCFQSRMWHPNIYKDGKVCISILHKPEEDDMGYEHIDERWSPAQSVHSVLLSVIGMLGSPNDESPANVDAAKMLREDRKAYKREVQRCVERSLEM
ncbi:hypothetical protein H4R20_004946 [Coemansia guatemalensis]|uniref:UBC core domain-containing protein n=1 Tax=Coemansia guatemalensis TaxID=2761395 RepID=A0A9W8LSM3_9FUNG|nr:hypothetical protein H4R20_004946 [Coemansia guatemalensis]